MAAWFTTRRLGWRVPSFLRVHLLFFFTSIRIQVSITAACYLRRDSIWESNKTKRQWKNIHSQPASCEHNDAECISSNTHQLFCPWFYWKYPVIFLSASKAMPCYFSLSWKKGCSFYALTSRHKEPIPNSQGLLPCNYEIRTNGFPFLNMHRFLPLLTQSV